MEQWAKEFIKWCEHHRIDIPQTQEELINLKIFDAKKRGLTALHPNIVYLKNLEKIILNHNMLTELPPLPKKVVALSLSHNFFRDIPEGIKGLKKLHTLTLGHNMIEKIPDWFELFPTLHILDITNNKIRSIQNLDKNTEIKILLVSDNKIKDISPIYNMHNLSIFDFSDNKVTKFDARIRNLKHLKIFSGLDNQIDNFDIFFLLKDTKINLHLTKKTKLRAANFLRYITKKIAF